MFQTKTKVTKRVFIQSQLDYCDLAITDMHTAMRELGLPMFSANQTAVIHRFMVDAAVQAGKTVQCGQDNFDFSDLNDITNEDVNDRIDELGGVKGAELADTIAKYSPKLN